MKDKTTRREKKSVKVDPVRIYDTHGLLTVNRQLGENYSVDVNNIEAMCEHNKKEAAAVGRKDLVRLWSMISITCDPMLSPSSNPDDGMPWAVRPFGRPLFESLIEYYMKIHDVQTLAMICCVFWDKKITLPSIPSSQMIKKSASKVSLEYATQNYNPYHTVSSMSGLLRSLTTPELGTTSESPPKTITSPISSFLARGIIQS